MRRPCFRSTSFQGFQFFKLFSDGHLGLRKEVFFELTEGVGGVQGGVLPCQGWRLVCSYTRGCAWVHAPPWAVTLGAFSAADFANRLLRGAEGAGKEKTWACDA